MGKVTVTAEKTPELRPTYMDLRALRVLDDHGWAKYVAGELARGLHVVQLGDRYRTLVRTPELRHEPYWWALGLADARGRGDVILALESERMPAMVPLTEAMELLPAAADPDRAMSRGGVTHNIGKGNLYALYGPYRVRHLFVDQVQAEAASRRLRSGADTGARAETALEKATAAWFRIRNLFPPSTRIRELTVNVTPKPSPDPLPITPGAAANIRQRRALIRGDKEGWFHFLHGEDDGSWVVELANGARRVLPPEGALPYVLGHADRHDGAELVAYRPGLG